MKTIGLIGGMGWESTQFYYRQINEGIRSRLGGLHSAQILLYSVDFDPIEKLQNAGDWDAAAEILSSAAQSLEAGGADFFLICTNTLHRVAEPIKASVKIPLLHIADATAKVLLTDGIEKIGLLGSAFTMEQAFYRDRVSDFSIEVIVPEGPQRRQVHDIIYQELCLGQVLASSKQVYLNIIKDLQQAGCEAIILGCTEICMLVDQQDTDIKLYDTTAIHAQQAVDRALSD
ncbi:MAG: aspartate/glutamate racemase family protein [Gammaproteobacteria bacterium]|nr:aspartate/glutamate racemase family protein [Gammaproteobacteria bacterium]